MSQVDCLWHLPPPQLSISQSEVHLWRVFLDRPAIPIEQLVQTLSGDEIVRSERFYFERDKNRFIVARALLRTILGGYLNVPADSLQFDYGQYGKPTIKATKVRFNLSHSHNLALYAITRDREVGIDVEFIRPITDAEQIANRYFSPCENAMFQALSSAEKPTGFFHHWTRKEAYLKAVGDGLAAGNDDFDETVATKSDRANRWVLRSFSPAAFYQATVAVEGSGWDMACWQLLDEG